MNLSFTEWKNVPDKLKHDFEEIICSDGGKVSTILESAINAVQTTQTKSAFIGTFTNDKDIAGCCWDFANYQLRIVCGRDCEKFKREGFQIGSPWHGDILKAKALFLSSNPGITYRCLFPRWHSDKKCYSMGLLDDAGCPISQISRENIYEFFTQRFQTTYLNNDRGLPSAWLINDDNSLTHKSRVPYWEALRKIMGWLLPNAASITPTEHTRRLMRSALSAEIIPFGSQREYGVTKAALKLGMNYTKRLIQHCGADILFLVGGKAIHTFNSAMKLNIKNGQFYSDVKLTFSDGSRSIHIAAIDAPNAHKKLNHKDVCDLITKDTKAASTLNAIQEIYDE